MKKRYKVWILDKKNTRKGYLEVWSHFGAFGAWLKVLWWKLTGSHRYLGWRHWPLRKS